MNQSAIAWFDTSDVFSRSVNSVRATGNLLTQEPTGSLQKPRNYIFYKLRSSIGKGKLTEDDEKTDTHCLCVIDQTV